MSTYNGTFSKVRSAQRPTLLSSWRFGHWILGFEICLEFGACYLEFKNRELRSIAALVSLESLRFLFLTGQKFCLFFPFFFINEVKQHRTDDKQNQNRADAPAGGQLTNGMHLFGGG